MSAAGGPNLVEDGLVFYYDTGNVLKSYKGEPTTNYITTMAANLGGNVSLSYPYNVYICTAQETNVVDPTAPGGQYSRFTGNTTSSNNQLFTSFVDGSVNARNTTVAYSVYLKGSGTCHLTVYSDIAGYIITPTINLTDKWTRYSIVQAVGNYTTHAWAAVRGILTSTNVYVAAQQIEFNTHVTPFVNGTRSATQGLLDVTGNSSIDLTNVSFDSNAQMTFDGTDDYIETADSSLLDLTTNMSFEFVVNVDNSQGNLYPRLIDKGSAYLIHINQEAPFGVYHNIYTSAGLRQTGTTSSIIEPNTWNHIVVTYDSQIGKIYINGELVRERDYGSPLDCSTNSSPVRIGGNGDTSRPLNGLLPVTKIYNRALTASEVASNFNGIRSRFGI